MLLAQRRVGHLLQRGGLDDDLGQGPGIDPLHDRGHAAAGEPDRLTGLLAELLLGRGIGRGLGTET